MTDTKRASRQTVTLDPVTREYLEGQFQRKFFEAAVEHEPESLECLMQLGDIYTRQGHYEKGLEIDAKLVDLCPQEPTFRYNLACSYALLDMIEQSVAALRDAIRLGYNDLDYLEKDEYLENVRGTREFRRLMAECFPRTG